MSNKLEKARAIIDNPRNLLGPSFDGRVKFKDFRGKLANAGRDTVRFNIIKTVSFKDTRKDGANYAMAFVSDNDGKPYFTMVADNPAVNAIGSIMNEVNASFTIVDKKRLNGPNKVSTHPIAIELRYNRPNNMLIVDGISGDFSERWHKDVPMGKWKSSTGSDVVIRDMNKYHLKNALRKCVRDIENRSKFFELKNELKRRGMSL